MKGDKELSINKVYRDLKKADKRKQIVESFNEPQLPDTEKKYNIIYADPPWNFKHYSDKGKGRSPENHYKCQSLKDIKELPISDLADDNCVLFMWVTYPFLEKGMEVIKSWGFTYKTVGFTWVKKNKVADTWFWGMGYWTRSNAEICIIATKGSITRQSSSVHQIIDTPIEAHSKKPDVTRERIVELCGDIPRIELFARQKVDGWDVWGNEVIDD
ncbi:adenine methyltransferase [archaeon]|nr:adenine methyltransferase [archaeon]